MKRTLIRNAVIVNEGAQFHGAVTIEGEKITGIHSGTVASQSYNEVIDAEGSYLLPGVID